MTLEEIKKALEGHEKASEIVNGVTDLLNSEKQKGIDSAKRLQADVKKYSKYKKHLEDLGFDGSTELDEFVNGLKTKLQESGKSGSDVALLQQRIDKLRKDYDAEKAKTRRVSLEQKIRGALTADRKWLGKSVDFITRNLIDDGRVDLSESGELVFKNGESVIDAADGIKTVIEENSDLLANEQKPGGGGAPGSGDGPEKFTDEQIKQAVGDALDSGM